MSIQKTAFDRLLGTASVRGGGFIVLIDPDKIAGTRLNDLLEACEKADVDALFLGGSLVHGPEFDQVAKQIKSRTHLPLIGFPGALNQLSEHLDALLFLSVVSGRNPEYLIGNHVSAAPIVRRLGLETIPTGYMLVESGSLTTAQYMIHSLPLPRKRPDVASATGLAAEMLGMKLLFTDAGSGADHAVPEEIIRSITSVCSIPLVVGGGLKSPEDVACRIEAGASFIVVGNAIEKNPDAGYLADLASAAHPVLPHSLGISAG